MITVELVQKVINLLTPSILAILAHHKDDGVFIKVILMNTSPWVNQGNDKHETISNSWIHINPNFVRPPKYMDAANAKAQYTLRTGKCSRETSLDGAHLIHPGDMIWPGSVNWNGLVVSTSGADDAMVDEGISNIVAATIMMECQVAVNRLKNCGAWICPNCIDHL